MFCTHESLAHQEPDCTCGLEFNEVLVCLQGTLRHWCAILWDASNQRLDNLQRGLESMEVAGIHADGISLRGKGTVEFALRVGFQQHFQAKSVGRGGEVVEL